MMIDDTYDEKMMVHMKKIIKCKAAIQVYGIIVMHIYFLKEE